CGRAARAPPRARPGWSSAAAWAAAPSAGWARRSGWCPAAASSAGCWCPWGRAGSTRAPAPPLASPSQPGPGVEPAHRPRRRLELRRRRAERERLGVGLLDAREAVELALDAVVKSVVVG